MTPESPIQRLSRFAAPSLGVFSGRNLEALGLTRRQLETLHRVGAVERVLADVYRMTAVAPTNEQRLRAALLWGGRDAAAAGRSAAELYRLEGVAAPAPEIVLPRGSGRRTDPECVVVRRPRRTEPLMVREHRGLRVTGVEATLVSLASTLPDDAFEIACEDARRRRLTSVPALYAYLDRFGGRGRDGLRQTRALLKELDPVYASRSTLEVYTRRLLIAHGLTGFTRELPLAWNGRVYFFDFAFERERVILETNGRRWHDDPLDYEDDHEKWSVPGRLGYRLIFATWARVMKRPEAFEHEVRAALLAAAS